MHQTAVAREVRRSPSREMPSPYIMSNSAWRNGGHFVFHHLHAYTATCRFVTFLDLADAPDIQADRA
jgi:hypothetical protein